MKKILLILFILCSAFKRSEEDVAPNVPLALLITAYLDSHTLADKPMGTLLIKGILNDETGMPLFETTVTAKIDETFNETFLIQPVNGKNQWMDVGICDFDYGSTDSVYYERVFRERLYPNNNIYTEKITTHSKFSFIVEDKVYLRQIFIDTIPFTDSILQYHFN